MTERTVSRAEVGRRILWVLASTAAWAVLCDLLLELSLRVSGSSAPLVPASAPVGMSVVWILVLGMVGLTGRMRWAMVTSLVLVLALAGINVARMQILHEPLVPSDVAYLSTPSFLLEMVDVRFVIVAALALVVFATVMVLVVQRVTRGRPVPPRRGDSGWTVWVGFRAVCVLLGASLVASAPGFHDEGNAVRGLYEAVGTEWLGVSHAANYRGNGFVGGALFSLEADPMTRPSGYGESRMREVARRWVEEAQRQNRDADDRRLRRTNVVVILSESLADPLSVRGFDVAEDPLPTIRSLVDSSGGKMMSASYGTGTSTMEFAVLTGQNPGLLAPQVVSPYQQFVARSERYPSVVGWLASLGHESVAIHPYRPDLYRRTDVYASLGFDRFLDQNDLQDRAAVPEDGFISDASAYGEVLHQLQTQEKPALVHLVTMQNHVPYVGHPRPIGVEGPMCCDAEVGQWARGLAETDRALEQFLGDLERAAEPTVVIHFGDHFPGIFDERLVQSQGLDFWLTPWFVWSNLDSTAASTQGVLSPASAMGVALQSIGAPMPPYLHLVAALQREVGTLRDDLVVTPSGEHVKIDDLSPDQQELVEEARLAQYDLSVGERFVAEDLWALPAP